MSEADHGRITGEHKQFSAWAQAAQKHGFKSPDEFGTYAPVLNAARERKIDPAMLARVLSGDPGDDGDEGDGKPLTMAQVQKMMAERDAENERKLAYREAESGHRSAYESRVKAIEESFGKKLGHLPEKVRKLLIAGVKAEHDEYRRSKDTGPDGQERLKFAYPDGHPLKDKFYANLDDKQFGEWSKGYDDLESVFKGITLKQIGEAAAKGSAAVAGAPKSEPGKKEDDDDREDHVTKFVRKHLAESAGAGV